MRVNRMICAVWCFVFAMCNVAEARQEIRFGIQGAGVAGDAGPQPFVLTATSSSQASFVSQADRCAVQEVVMADGLTYHRIDVPGLASRDVPGEPRLPYHSQFIRVPDGVEARLVIDSIVWEDVPGTYSVEPVQPPRSPSQLNEILPFEKNAKTYAQKQWVPEQPLQIGERVRVRGRDFLHVMYSPVAWHPATGALRVAPTVHWRLEYELPDDVQSFTTTTADILQRPDPVGEEAFSFFFDDTLNAVPEAQPSRGMKPMTDPPGILSDDPGADYLIIYPTEFVTPVAMLAQLKIQMGLTIRMTSLDTIGPAPTAHQIRDYIQNAYDTWTRRPTYLLLVGDAEILPPFNAAAFPHRPTMPATDLYYATLDGDDIFPDVFYGRIPAATRAECLSMVNKIIQAHVSPTMSATVRSSALINGKFEGRVPRHDGTFWGDIGVENPRFMEEGEALKNYLERQSWTVHTAYFSDMVTPSRRYSDVSQFHEPMSHFIGTQEYITPAAVRQRTLDRWNAGVSLVSYHAHGSPGGWETFDLTDAALLTNSLNLPVVLSLTCSSGHFDWDADDCFAERLLKMPGGGASAVFASTRVAYMRYNFWFRHGIHESFWPGYFGELSTIPGYRTDLAYAGNPVGRSPRLGQALQFGNRVMYEKLGGMTDRNRYSFEINMLFGDPHMHFQPWNDYRVNAEHPATTGGGQATFDVYTFTEGGSPLSGVTVTVTSTAGDHEVRTSSAAGVASFSFAPQAVDFLSVEATQTARIPYRGRIELVTEPMVVHHPASISAVAAAFSVTARTAANQPIADARVWLHSEAGDDREAFTDATGTASFGIIPQTLSLMHVQVSKRSFTTYNGSMEVVPGTLIVEHDDIVDEASGPFEVLVRRSGGGGLSSVEVTLSTGTGVVLDTRTTGLDGIVSFPSIPYGVDELIIDSSTPAYTPVQTTARVVPGYFKWDPLPLEQGVRAPFPATVELVSSRDGETVLPGFNGLAMLSAFGDPQSPPPVVVTDCRRYLNNSVLRIQNVQTTGTVSLEGWLLLRSLYSDQIDSVHPVIKELTGVLDPLEVLDIRPTDWGALQFMRSDISEWIMLLDANTNIVDFVAWGWTPEELALMAPVIRGSAVPVGDEWNGDGIPRGSGGENDMMTTRIRSQSPRDRNTAEDFAVSSTSFFQPAFDEPFAPYGAPVEVSPISIGPFVNGVWSGPITVNQLAPEVVLQAGTEMRLGLSSMFDVIVGGLSHYEVGIPPTITYGQPFTVVIEAMDDNVVQENFEGEVCLYASVAVDAPPVLIVECGIRFFPMNFVDIQHVSYMPEDTTGWKLVAGDDPANINHVNPVAAALPDDMFQSLILSWQDSDPQAADYWGTKLGWQAGQPGWVMLLDDASQVVDFVVWGWDAESIAGMAPQFQGDVLDIAGHWAGPGFGANDPGFGLTSGSLQRQGDVDNNRALDFVWNRDTYRGLQKPGLTVPLIEARRPLEMTPLCTGPFTAGTWTGEITLLDPGQNVTLEIIDEFGTWGATDVPFDIVYYGELALSIPSPVNENDGSVEATVTSTHPRSTTVHLSSSDPAELQPPANVLIGFAQYSNTFAVGIVDNHNLDFTRQVEIVATAPGFRAASATVTILDDEDTAIVLDLPESVTEGDGLLVDAAWIMLGGNVLEDTVFAMTWSDLSKLTIPLTVTVAAGTDRASFNLDVIDNSVAEGPVEIDIYATPDGIIFGTGTLLVQDNDAFEFVIDALPAVATAGVPFAVSIEARDIWGDRVDAYTGSAVLDAAGSELVPLTPMVTGPFVNGVWSGSVAAMALGQHVWLNATDGPAMGWEGPFDVVPGPLAGFRWVLPDLEGVHAGAWLYARMQAVDAHGFIVADFDEPVELSGERQDPEHPVRVLSFVKYADPVANHTTVSAAIRRHFSYVAETATSTVDPVALAAELALHDVLLVPGQSLSTSGRMGQLGVEWRQVLNDFVDAGGIVVACYGGGDEHVLLREAHLANLIQESLGGGMTARPEISIAITNQLTVGVPDSFSGAEAVGYSAPDCEGVVVSTINGAPAVMHRQLGGGHVVMIGYDFSMADPGFDRVLANAIRMGLKRVVEPHPVAPAQVQFFTEGEWDGLVQLGAESSIDMALIASTGNGYRGVSELFDLAPLRLQQLSLSDSWLELRWNSAGLTEYEIWHSVTGPEGPYERWIDWREPATPPVNTISGAVDDGAQRFFRLQIPAP